MIEILSGIALALAALVLLAAVGVVTLAAFVLMAVLGLISDWSFKKVFFVSFALGLFAPILLGGAVVGAIEDGSLQQEFQDAINQREGVTISLEDANDLREALPPREELEQLFEERPDLRERIPERVLERLLESSDEIDEAIEAVEEIDAPGDGATE